jgi:hypothetical protein
MYIYIIQSYIIYFPTGIMLIVVGGSLRTVNLGLNLGLCALCLPVLASCLDALVD